MGKKLKSKPICGRPVHNYFVGKDKYLKLQEHTISDLTPPIAEQESLFILIQSGIGIITINGVEFNIQEGSFIWLQSYHTFTIKCLSDNPIEMYVCVYDYPLSSFLTFRKPLPNNIKSIMTAVPIIELKGLFKTQIENMMEDFKEENDCTDPGSSLIKVSILGQFAKYFIDHSINHNHNRKNDDEFPLGWKAILFISEYFSCNLTAENVAQVFNSNATTLNRELRQVSGYNFNHILNSTRVNIASSALLYEDISLGIISENSGFPTEVSFYRTFKKFRGMTPIEYRKELLEQHEQVYRGMIMATSLMEILNHAYTNFSDPTDYEDTAKELFLSKTTIRDLLFEKFGLNYKDITTKSKIRYAEALLVTTDLPVLDIAINVGFNCARSFSRTFTKVHDMTPSQFRQKYSNVQY